MLHGLNISKLVLLSSLLFTYSNDSYSHILQYQGLYSRCATHTQSNWQWRDLFQIVRSRKNH